MNKFLFGLAFTLIVLSCKTTESITLPETRCYFPIKNEFSIIPDNYNKKAVPLRFNGIYKAVYLDSALTRGTSTVYYRFWPNGRVLLRSINTQNVTLLDVEHFSQSVIGYYKIEGNKLIMELWMWYHGTMSWVYQKSYCHINRDGEIIINKREWGNVYSQFLNKTPDKPAVIYRFNSIKGLKKSPDW